MDLTHPNRLPPDVHPAVGQKLWVQLAGYPAWPCIVRDPDAKDVIGTDVPNRPKRGTDTHFLVQWYGTGQVSWINARSGNCWLFNGRTDEFAKRVLKKMQSQYDQAIDQACLHNPHTTIDTDYDSAEDRSRDEAEEPEAKTTYSSSRGGMDALTSAAAAAEAASTSPRGRSSGSGSRSGRKRSRSEGKGRGRKPSEGGEEPEGDDADSPPGHSEGGPSAGGDVGAGERCGLGLLAAPDAEFEALLHAQGRTPSDPAAIALRLARLGRALASGLDAFRAAAAAAKPAAPTHDCDPKSRGDSEVRALTQRLRTEEESRYKVQELLGVERQERLRLEEEVRVLRAELARARQREKERAAGPSTSGGVAIKREGGERPAAAAAAAAAAADSDTETDTDEEAGGEKPAAVRPARRKESREQLAFGAG